MEHRKSLIRFQWFLRFNVVSEEFAAAFSWSQKDSREFHGLYTNIKTFQGVPGRFEGIRSGFRRF